jgi:hypothetical protein
MNDMTTSELRAKLRRLENILAADVTGRTAELERGIARVRAEVARREALVRWRA